MKSFQTIRLNVSSYQSPFFLQKEKESLQSLGLRYCCQREELDSSALILLTNTHTDLGLCPELLARTQLIIHPNSGYDNLSKDYSLLKNIPTIIGHEIRAHAVSEWILSCFFEASITRPVHPQWDQTRQWNRTRLKDKEVVVFGYGHIGKMVVSALRAVGTTVHVIDPYVEGCFKDFKELPSKFYHALIPCCGLNDKNRLMFNKKLFNYLSFEFFINGARGGLVNEEDLKDYLTRHPHSRAYLDVFNQEPFSEDANHPQVIKSSHIAGVYGDLDQEIINFERKVLFDFLHLDSESFNKKYYLQLLSSKMKEGVII